MMRGSGLPEQPRRTVPRGTVTLESSELRRLAPRVYPTSLAVKQAGSRFAAPIGYLSHPAGAAPRFVLRHPLSPCILTITPP